MSKRAWFRSLYWRIAMGFVAFVATLMVVQGAATVWFLARTDTLAGGSPMDLAALVASDLGTAWSADENLDLESHLRDHYRSRWRPVGSRWCACAAKAPFPRPLRRPFFAASQRESCRIRCAAKSASSSEQGIPQSFSL